MKAQVILFKPSGKYYTEEEWEIPKTVKDRSDERGDFTRDCIIPADMEQSPNFRRIDGGAVLVLSQEPWGYPHLFPGRTVFPDVPNPVTLDDRLTKVEKRLEGIIETHHLWDGS